MFVSMRHLLILTVFEDCDTTCVASTEPSTPYNHLKRLGVIDRAHILQHLISRVKIKYQERYVNILDSIDLEAVLEGNLSPAVRETCENGKFTRSRYVSKVWKAQGMLMMLISCSKLGRDRRQS
jgi:hypothetical protein